MRVINKALAGKAAYGPFQPVHFDARGISEEIPADVGHYLCRFPGYKPYRTEPRPSRSDSRPRGEEAQPTEPDSRATKDELLAFCDRHNIGGVSEEMTKRQIAEHIHAALMERQGQRVPDTEAPVAEPSEGEQGPSEEEEEE